MKVCTFTFLSILITVLQYEFGYSIANTNDPVQCGPSYCTISSTYGVWPDRMACRAAQVVYPTTEDQILAAVAAAVQKKQKMKVVSRLAHSIPKLVCPGGNDGLVISTRDYNQHLVIDKHNMRVEVDSGIELRPLIDSIAQAGLALPYTPYWEGLSIGGLLSTGAHGSSFFQKGGAVHEYVVGMRFVIPATAEEGFAKVIEVTEDDEELLNAAKVSLGVLGVISKVTLQLEPMFKHSITNEVLEDDDLEDRILPFASEYEFGDVLWHPAERKAAYKKDIRVSVDVPGDGINDFIGFQPIDAVVVEGVRALETAFESNDDAEGKCISARLQVGTLQAVGSGLKNNGYIFTGYPIIGYHHRLQTSGSCLYSAEDDTGHDHQLQRLHAAKADAPAPRRDMCSWDRHGAADLLGTQGSDGDVDVPALHGICLLVDAFRDVCAWDSSVEGEFFHQTTLSIGVSKVQAFLRDVKALRDLNHKGFCVMDLYYGVYLRFVKASSAFLGEQEDSVNVDITYYRSREPGNPRLLEDVIEEVEQMATFKYGGRPHWGKNRPVAFSRVWEKYPNLHRFLAVKDRFDPDGLFSSEWSDAVLGIAPNAEIGTITNPWPSLLASYTHDGCALEGLCICYLDSHCAPDLGYFCQFGNIYRQARVCRKMSPASMLNQGSGKDWFALPKNLFNLGKSLLKFSRILFKKLKF